MAIDHTPCHAYSPAHASSRPFKTNTLLLPSRRSRRRGFCFSGRPSALKMPGTHACSRPRCHATLLTLALHMQQDRRLHRRAAVVLLLLRSAAYGGGARQRVLSSRTVSMQCKSPQQSPARPPAYIHTYGFWMDALPSAPCTAKPPLPESSSISDMDGCLGAKYIYRYGTIFFKRRVSRRTDIIS